MRARLAFFVVLAFIAAVAAGCGGGEETTPSPDDVQGTVPADTGGGDTGAADTGETETGDDGGGGGEGDPAAGKDVFASAGCGSCHTLSDAGSTGSVGPNLDESQPDFELAHDRVTNGAGAMPAFKDQLSEQQINDVSAYVAEAAGA
jgi:mono/diheme cytochrome c family protein